MTDPTNSPEIPRKCVECGATENLVLEHVEPWPHGPEPITNMRYICGPCSDVQAAKAPTAWGRD